MKARVKSGSLKMSKEIREALEAEAERMAREAIDEMNRKNEEEVDAMALYILHTEFGFGEKRLRRFFDSFYKGLSDLGERYVMTNYDERIWLAKRRLREDCGIDISEWEKEKKDECAG